MDLDFSCWGEVPIIEFAFTSKNFFDMVVQLEVVACDDFGAQSLPDSARRPKVKGEYCIAHPPTAGWIWPRVSGLSFALISSSSINQLLCFHV